MNPARQVRISVASALRLIDLLNDLARQADDDAEKKILLRAGIKLADLVLKRETAARRTRRAA